MESPALVLGAIGTRTDAGRNGSKSLNLQGNGEAICRFTLTN
jgi:hypothetical protein